MTVSTFSFTTMSIDMVLGHTLLTSVADLTRSCFTIIPTPPLPVSSPFQFNLYSKSPHLNFLAPSFLYRTSCKATTSTFLLPMVSVASEFLPTIETNIYSCQLKLNLRFHAKVSSILLNSQRASTGVAIDLTLSVSMFSFFLVVLFALCTPAASTEEHEKKLFPFVHSIFSSFGALKILWSHVLADTNHQI